MVRIRSIYDSLEDSLDDCPLKDLALDCTWLEVSGYPVVCGGGVWGLFVVTNISRPLLTPCRMTNDVSSLVVTLWNRNLAILSLRRLQHLRGVSIM